MLPFNILQYFPINSQNICVFFRWPYVCREIGHHRPLSKLSQERDDPVIGGIYISWCSLEVSGLASNSTTPPPHSLPPLTELTQTRTSPPDKVSFNSFTLYFFSQWCVWYIATSGSIQLGFGYGQYGFGYIQFCVLTMSSWGLNVLVMTG